MTRGGHDEASGHDEARGGLYDTTAHDGASGPRRREGHDEARGHDDGRGPA